MRRRIRTRFYLKPRHLILLLLPAAVLYRVAVRRRESTANQLMQRPC